MHEMQLVILSFPDYCKKVNTVAVRHNRHINMFKYQNKRVLLTINVCLEPFLIILPNMLLEML